MISPKKKLLGRVGRELGLDGGAVRAGAPMEGQVETEHKLVDPLKRSICPSPSHHPGVVGLCGLLLFSCAGLLPREAAGVQSAQAFAGSGRGRLAPCPRPLPPAACLWQRHAHVLGSLSLKPHGLPIAPKLRLVSRPRGVACRARGRPRHAQQAGTIEDTEGVDAQGADEGGGELLDAAWNLGETPAENLRSQCPIS